MRQLLMLVVLCFAGVAWAGDTEDPKHKQEKKAGSGTGGTGVTLDERQLNSLKAAFCATSFKVNEEDATVTVTYDFSTKDATLLTVFNPPMEKTKNRIRWSRGYEGTWSTVEDGLVIADHGVWLHDAFWRDVTIEVDYLSMSAIKKGDVLAPVFLPKKGKKLYGANLGRQCVKLKPNVKLAARPIPRQFPTAAVHNRLQFGLKVQKQVVTALNNGRATADSSKDPKFLKKASAGQVGLAWRGTVNGFVFKITMTGKLDPEWVKQQVGK